MKKTRIAVVAGVTSAMLALAGCAGAEPAAEPTASAAGEQPFIQMNVGITPIINAADVYVGIEQGFFEEQGLEVNPVVVQNTSTAIPSLLNGELQVALINSVAAVTAGSKGLPVEMIGGSDRYPDDASNDTTALIVNPESGITSLADLEGRTIAIVGLRSGPEVATRVVLDEAGVDSEGVSFVELAYPDMVAAVQGNRVDAAFIVDPFLSKAKAEGLEIVSQPFTDGIGGMSAMTWLVSQEYAAANADAITRFNVAIQEAADFSNENPDAVRAVLPQFTPLTEAAIQNAVLSRYDSTLAGQDLNDWSELLSSYGFIDAGYDASGLIAQQ